MHSLCRALQNWSELFSINAKVCQQLLSIVPGLVQMLIKVFARGQFCALLCLAALPRTFLFFDVLEIEKPSSRWCPVSKLSVLARLPHGENLITSLLRAFC